MVDDGRPWADNPRFDALALEVAKGQSVPAAAPALGQAERTARRLAARPEFRARVAELRRDMTAQALGELTAGATEAAQTLRSLLAPKEPPALRLVFETLPEKTGLMLKADLRAGGDRPGGRLGSGG